VLGRKKRINALAEEMLNADYVEAPGQPGQYLPRALLAAYDALEGSFEPYACLREGGATEEDALEMALRMNTAPENLPLLDKFLSGRLTLNTTQEEGLKARQGFIDSLEHAWHKYQSLDGWDQAWPKFFEQKG
jgi:hypothetical protein